MPSKNNILISLSESDKTQFGKQDIATQSVPQQVFSSVWAVEAEVNNGGFSQFFLNDSCETAAFVAKALDAIGASANCGYMQAGPSPLLFQRDYRLPRLFRPLLRIFPMRFWSS